MEQYFNALQEEINSCYQVAERARKKGLDPELFVESPQARDLAGRVEKLVGPAGVANVIRELKKQNYTEDQIVFQVVSDILEKKIGNIESLEERVERAIRAGLAIKTMGVVSAPLEGISKILIKTDQFGNKYLSLYFSGPIRAAGGTTAALCVLIADYVRKKSSIPRYEAMEGEIGRFVEEIKLYDRLVHLQYPSSNKEIRFAVKSLPVEINGDPTEKEEVSAFRDLPRIETNNVRGGACLVLNDGILLKAPKLLKIAREMNIEGWEWLGELRKIAAEESKREDLNEDNASTFATNQEKISPNSKYIKDIIAGRPVFAHPSVTGGHRIRYGRSRNTGLAAGGIHPATMAILDDFIAIGTQLRTERPGKSTSICPVDSIEPPIVKLKNGDVIKITSHEKAKKIFPKIEEILFLGDILFGFGEFAENNHILIPSGYVEEWWALDLEKALKDKNIEDSNFQKFIKDPFNNIPTSEEAISLSKTLDIPLHPAYLDFWGNVSVEEVLLLRSTLLEGYSDGMLIIKNTSHIKKILEKAFILHRLKDDKIIFSKAMTTIYTTIFNLEKKEEIQLNDPKDVFDLFYQLSSIKIRNKAPYFMGTRMGRPEKSERKSMKGVHALFPLSDKVGNSRKLEKALEFEKIKIDVCRKKCPKCNIITIFNSCPKCGQHAELQKICERCKKYFPIDEDTCDVCGGILSFSSPAAFNIKNHVQSILKHLNVSLPPNVKGIYGLTNKFKIPEPLEKGILRAKNDVLVYKTAEIRYDATDIPLTHFKPKEIGISVAKLKELGYDVDQDGMPLENENQIVELKVQDVILSEDCADYLVKVANFLDDELEYFYKIKRYYNVSKRQDLIGHLVVGLAPHTSAGIIGRIIGFTPARSIYAHPFWHGAKRRNCFPGNTSVLIDDEGTVKKLELKKLYEDFFEDEIYEKQAIIKKTPIKNIQVYSYDANSGKIQKTSINEVMKIPYSNQLIHFKLETGREFETTLDHPVLVYSNGKLVEKKAFQVEKSDAFLLPTLEFEIIDVEFHDLIKEFNRNEFKDIWKDLMVSEIKDFTKSLIDKLGLKETAERLNLNKKTLNKYYSKKDSIPFNILLRLLEMHDLSVDNVPNCKLGFKRDHAMVNRYVPDDDSLMKLIGYYIAEGYVRKTPKGYQVDFIVSEEDLKQDILKSAFSSFGKGFNLYVNDNKITISNRVIYHFFKDILKLKNNAREKHFPPFLFKIPKEKIKYLLAAYFSGGGAIDICRKTVVCSTFSRKLIHDLDTLLLRYGIFGGLSSQEKKLDIIEYKLKISGKNVLKFKEQIGFISLRKTKALEMILKTKKTIPERIFQNHKILRIKKIEQVKSNNYFVYSLNADKFHTVLINENIITKNCDGDEDGVMLLLDPLLNFSRYYLPSKIGGRMDATLVISSLLDPNEIDVEAHNIDTLTRYPLEFYEATLHYPSPSEVENMMNLVKSRLGTPDQYENIRYNIPTSNINAGALVSSYKTHESMEEKIEAQMHLAKIIRAVDEKNVAEKILASHFTPDILGNLRKFAVQGFRCVKCNTSYRRPPLSNGGKCLKCNGRIILTVNRGGIEKYIPRAKKLCETFHLDKYTLQRMELIEEYVKSLTNNPKLKQQKLSDFF